MRHGQRRVYTLRAMPDRPFVLLWYDGPGPYRDAVERAGLAGHIEDVTPGITVLPHIGGMHPTRDEFVAALFADNLERCLSGQPLRELVSRERGY